MAVGFGAALAVNASAATQPALTVAAPTAMMAAHGTAGGLLPGHHGEDGAGGHRSPATRALEGSSKAVLLRANPILRRGEDEVASDD